MVCGLSKNVEDPLRFSVKGLIWLLMIYAKSKSVWLQLNPRPEPSSRSTNVTPTCRSYSSRRMIDKALGLELGADDYILKPFGVRDAVTGRWWRFGTKPPQTHLPGLLPH